MMTHIDQVTVEEMRQLARQGATPTQLLYFLRGRLPAESPIFDVDVVRYFHVAFNLGVGDAKLITSVSSMFSNGTWSDKDVDERLLPLIRGDRSRGQH